MPLPRAAAAALAAFALALVPPRGGGVLAAEAPRAGGAPEGRSATVQIGPATGDAEKDSVGFAPGAHDDCGLVPLFARDAVAHGPRTGDPEKDSLGFRVAGQYDSCAGTIR